jgi:GT2 family glycosyltransferase
LLAALAAQDLPAVEFEVVVYDDASGDGTAELVRQHAKSMKCKVRLIEGERNMGPAHGRNTAWRAARAPLVAFTDDDCVPATDWLRNGSRAFSDPTVGAVVGHVEPAPDQLHLLGPFSRTLRVTDARFFATANCIYRRDALEAVDGFDERFRRAAGEDTDLGLRMIEVGWTAGYAADALVHHDVRASDLRAAMREAWLKWIDLALVVRKHPQIRNTLLYGRVFWKKSHALLLLAVLGAIASAFVPWAGLLAAPYVYYRLWSLPLAGGLRRLTTFPGALLLDLLEVGAMLRGTARYRTLIV